MRELFPELENPLGSFMDPIADMLIKIKNGNIAYHDAITVPYSKLKEKVAECLKDNGYLSAVSKRMKKNFPVLFLKLAYGEESKPKINDVKRISKPSKRVYFSAKEIKPVKNGYGLLVLSTPKGILTGGQARKEQVGGEVLFNIW